ncbi:YhgE/Pip domain-containing protein [Oceanobacillus limi]
MRRMKKILFVLAAVVLILPSFLVTASTSDSKSEDDTANSDGEISSKDEVVYATLHANGESQDIYVVNTFDISESGNVIDFGNYSSVKNLTDLSEIEQSDNKVQFTAEEGKFYYQGNMDKEPLPWDVSVAYYLDGKEISPEEIAGKEGSIQIRIETAANENVDPIFYENYLLQISLPLDTSIFSNIRAEDGMVANAGKNKQVTFTVMPEKEETLVVEADAVGFELDGVEITGIPSSMSIEEPDVDEMTGEMRTLSDAIAELNDGVGELENGVSELNRGVADLQDGSGQFNRGLADLDGGSGDLVNGSEEIAQALETITKSLGDADDMDLSDLDQLANGLGEIVKGLDETVQGLERLKGNYATAYNALDEAMEAIPSHNVSKQEIQELYSSGAEPDVVDRLVETYTAARTAKGTYDEVKQAFGVVDQTLEGVIDGLSEMKANLETMASELSTSLENMDTDGLAQLQEGLTSLSKNYDSFHDGLVDYTGGVNELSNAYKELHGGIVDLSDGTSELENGVGELHDGTTELDESTSDLPDQMTDEIDQMMNEYDKSDFEAKSFVSEENEKVNSVQFILKTESITNEDPETTDAPEEVEEEKGFWEKLMALFK